MIEVLEDDEGVWRERVKCVPDIVEMSFSDIFSSSCLSKEAMDLILNYVSTKIIADINEYLAK